jgi:metal-dependent amidase/aminoacylase/carboxypeptidase family protein
VSKDAVRAQQLPLTFLSNEAHPELCYEEHYAHNLLTEFMSQHGFEVTPEYCGIETAWRAEWTSAISSTVSRTIGVNSEMDALPQIGHACGHNLIAIAGVGVALALRAAMEKHQLPGKIILLGTPAEEGGAGKQLLLDKGGYEGMDICVMCHPSSGPAHSANCNKTLAMKPITVEYFGRG